MRSPLNVVAEVKKEVPVYRVLLLLLCACSLGVGTDSKPERVKGITHRHQESPSPARCTEKDEKAGQARLGGSRNADGEDLGHEKSRCQKAKAEGERGRPNFR